MSSGIPKGEHIVETKTCRVSGQKFHITDKDMEFYDQVSPVFLGKKYNIPTPNLCPDERLRKRLAWRNERNFYARSCSATGKKLISPFSQGASFPLYENKYWWSDAWSGIDFGKEIDFSRPFFEQFIALHNKVPQLPMINDNKSGSENCEYCYDFAFGRDCYFAIGMWYARDCLYATLCDNGEQMIDSDYVYKSRLSYECLYSRNLSSCVFLNTSSGCSDCWFGSDLIGCKDCLFCIGLRQKQYCIFNKQYTPERYAEMKEELSLGSYKQWEILKKKWQDFSEYFPQSPLFQMQSENCLGDMVFNCNDTYECHAIYNAKNCKHIIRTNSPQNSHDLFNTGNPSWCYEGLTPDNSHNALFTTWCWKCSNVLYSDNCHSSQNLFGCIGLKRQKHCILNKAYSEHEYQKQAGKLIDHMRSTGEWGEFFPIQMSPYPYNDSVAQDYFPLDASGAKKRGVTWKDFDANVHNIKQTYTIPDHIDDVDVDICQEALVCEQTGKAFKIQKNELGVYKTLGIPIPRLHPSIRRSRRLKVRNSHKLFVRTCDQCACDIQTIHAPENKRQVFCMKCYEAYISKYPK